MSFSDRKLILISIFFMIVGGLLFLHFYKVNPEDTTISKISDGKYVKIVGTIISMKVVKDRYGYIKKIKYIKIGDETGGDLRIVAFGKVNNDLVKYITKSNPMIKEGDIVQVVGTVSTYNGLYEIVLKDADDFKLVEKRNFEKDIYLSPNPTNIYASKNGKTYHISKDCPYGRKISDKNIIYFYSEDDAKALGYKLCKWCSKNG